MRKTASILTMKGALTRERRMNKRLRQVLETLRKDLVQTQSEVQMQFTRLAQLQAEVDVLRASQQREANAPRPLGDPTRQAPVAVSGARRDSGPVRASESGRRWE